MIKTRSESAWLLLQWILGIVDYKICEAESEPVKAEIEEYENNITLELQALEKIKVELSKNKQMKEKHTLEIHSTERAILVLGKEIEHTKLQIDV